QQTVWSNSEIAQVEIEKNALSEVILLNDRQKDLLTQLLLEKNKVLNESIRKNWNKKVFLQRIEEVIRKTKLKYTQQLETHAMKKYIADRILPILLLFVLFGATKLQAQTPSTIINSNPTDEEILESLTGDGMTSHLGNGDGLVVGERNSQVAIFNNGLAAGFGMDEGILFTTGNTTTELSNKNVETQSSNGPGSTYTDPDLTGIFSQAVNDVVIYKFKVTLASHTSAIRVVFQFGSEEYPDYVGSEYNDSFGFFIRPAGNGATLPDGNSVINMARLPYSNNPISINTVNYGYPGYSGTSSYPGLDLNQSQYYINNGHTTTVNNGR
ncbi:hypothetical protein GWI33_011460, partial [Rhynchophorus ferrugineus]